MSTHHCCDSSPHHPCPYRPDPDFSYHLLPSIGLIPAPLLCFPPSPHPTDSGSPISLHPFPLVCAADGSPRHAIILPRLSCVRRQRRPIGAPMLPTLISHPPPPHLPYATRHPFTQPSPHPYPSAPNNITNPAGTPYAPAPPPPTRVHHPPYLSLALTPPIPRLPEHRHM